MIKIEIQIKDSKIYESFIHEKSTLNENALAVRTLESIKQDLLDIDYEDDLRIDYD